MVVVADHDHVADYDDDDDNHVRPCRVGDFSARRGGRGSS
jgi:hypothetical protein